MIQLQHDNRTTEERSSERACRICQHIDQARERFDKPAAMFRCAHCGCVQIDELPSEATLAAFYGRAYLDKYTAGMSPQRFSREMPRRHAAKLDLVQRMAHPTTLLDVGCGEGDFLAQAVQRGIKAQGCDFGLRSEYPPGVSVTNGNIDQRLPFADASFDVVTCWAVLEHLREPHHAVREIFRVLRPGGYTFWDTPLADDWCERLVPARSHWFCPPEHLHVFSARGLRLLAEEARFEVTFQSPFHERNLMRFFARRLRNLAVGVVCGGAVRIAAPSHWRAMRLNYVTPIGDIQLLVAQKPASLPIASGTN